MGIETRLITKLFKNTNIKISHISNNNLGKFLDTQRATKVKSKFDKNGLYQLTRPTWQKKYIAHRGRPFNVGFREY